MNFLDALADLVEADGLPVWVEDALAGILEASAELLNQLPVDNRSLRQCLTELAVLLGDHSDYRPLANYLARLASRAEPALLNLPAEQIAYDLDQQARQLDQRSPDAPAVLVLAGFSHLQAKLLTLLADGGPVPRARVLGRLWPRSRASQAVRGQWLRNLAYAVNERLERQGKPLRVRRGKDGSVLLTPETGLVRSSPRSKRTPEGPNHERPSNPDP